MSEARDTPLAELEEALLAAEPLDDASLESLAERLAVEPPAELRARVLEQATSAPVPSTLRRSIRVWRGVGSAALAASALLAVLYAFEVGRQAELRAELAQAVASSRELADTREDLIARLESQHEEFAVLEEAVGAQREVVRILASPRLMTAALADPEGGSGSARVLLDPITGKTAIIGSGLEPPQAGRVYAIWAIHGDGTTRPAGVLSPRVGRSFAARVHEVPEPRDVAEFAISLERDPEAKKPSGPIILAGAVDGAPGSR